MPFTDIAGTSWESAITWVYQHAVMVDGCSETRFCPKASITRGALAQALADGLRLPATGGDFYADDEGSPLREGHQPPGSGGPCQWLWERQLLPEPVRAPRRAGDRAGHGPPAPAGGRRLLQRR